ncbi:MAG TPA: hypothetical protein VGH66_00425 [Acidimicrobiales bacterium]
MEAEEFVVGFAQSGVDLDTMAKWRLVDRLSPDSSQYLPDTDVTQEVVKWCQRLTTGVR